MKTTRGVLVTLATLLCVLVCEPDVCIDFITAVKLKYEYAGFFRYTFCVLPWIIWKLASVTSMSDEESVTRHNELIKTVQNDGRYRIERVGGYDDDFTSEVSRNKSTLSAINKLKD